MDILNQQQPNNQNNAPDALSQDIVPPPPKTPDITVRTMESDIASVKKSGGGEPKPQFITISPLLPNPPAQNAAHEPNKPMEYAAIPQQPIPEERRGHGLFWTITLIILIGGGGWATYAYVLPLLTQNSPVPQAPAQQTPAAPVMQAPEPQPLSNNANTSPIPAPFDQTPATLVAINDYTMPNIRAGLQNETNKKPASGNGIKEITLTNENAPVAASNYIAAILPETKQNGFHEAIATAFENNLHAYLFYDDKGAWPAYAFSIKPASGVDTVTLSERIQKIEASSYANFFITPPGSAQPFKTGQVAQKYINRSALFSQPGASFSYGLYGQYLIISTSSEGLIKILEALKL